MNTKFISVTIALIVIVAIVIFSFSLLSAKGVSGNSIKLANNAPVKEFVMQSYTEVIDGKYHPQFSIKEVSVKKGDHVIIKVTNTKGSHNFNIDEYNIHQETPLDKEVVIDFIANKTGSFQYYCSMPGHRQNGHFGTLIVS